VLSGVSVLTNLSPANVALGGEAPQFAEVIIQPDGPVGLARYPQLRPPVLFIRGEHDRVVDDASAEWFCRTVPNGRFLRIPDCGHVPQEERPEAVIAAIRRLWEMNQARASGLPGGE